MGLSVIIEWQPPQSWPWLTFFRTTVTEGLKAAVTLLWRWVTDTHACTTQSYPHVCARTQRYRQEQREACTDLHRHTQALKAHTDVPMYSQQDFQINTKPQTHTDTHTCTHSLSCNDMRLTYIDRLICVRVCGSVKAPLTHTSPYSTLLYMYNTELPTSLFWMFCQHQGSIQTKVVCPPPTPSVTG